MGGLAAGGAGARLARTRDLILIDQRGVGRSAPALECSLKNATSQQTVVTFYQACAARLRADGNDLSAYTTLNNVRDLDQVRQALGYAQLNIFGTSYGARLAQQALRGAPPWIRSVALSSPIPAEENFVADVGSSFAAALARTFATCRSSRTCNRRYPGLARSLDRTMRRLTARPAAVRVRAGGRTRTVPITAGDVSAVLFSAYYAPGGVVQVIRLVDALGHGDLRALASGGGGGLSASSISIGMELTFLCQEEAAYGPASLNANARRLPLAARALVATNPIVGQPLLSICSGWGVPKADPVTFQPVTSATPALVFTGQFDQITPPRYGQTVSRQLPNSTLVRVPFVGHSPALGAQACGAGIIARFFDDPSVKPDTACIAKVGG